MTTKPKQKEADLKEADVAAWLDSHRDFFEGRDNLLLKMTLPHAHSTNNGEAISLVERQVSLLRERNGEARKHLDELLGAARRNDEILSKCHRLVLTLLEAKDSNSFFKALESSFKREFKSDAYSLIIFSAYANQINHFTSSVPAESAREFIGGLMKAKEPFLGALRPAEQDFLFRHASDNVKSAAVLPVKGRKQIALLAIGNADPNYFTSAMGTTFITFIADVIARLLPRYVYLNPDQG
ncbi:MAG TPA: DUF484 family protein [Pseudomonadales bacterium]|nr:DUF484 family protein [Pseudomonadales bacterium]